MCLKPETIMPEISPLSFFSGDSTDKFLDEFKIGLGGEVTTSIRGAARLAGVADNSLRNTFQSAQLEPSKLAQILISKGFEPAQLEIFSETGIPELAVATIVFYYAYKAGRYCNETAERNAELISAIGLRSLVQKSLSWQPQVQAAAMTQTQLVAALAQQMVAQEQQLNDHEQLLADLVASRQTLEDRLDIIEVETIANIAELERFRDGHGHWYTIAGWCSLKGHKNKSLKELKDLGTKAAAMCRERGIAPQEMPDPRFGTVGLYPQSILIDVFDKKETLSLPQPQPLATNLVQMTPRLTSFEKRRAVNRFLDQIENSLPDDPRRTWGSRKIGQYLGVSNRMVLYIKQERSGKRQPPKYASFCFT